MKKLLLILFLSLALPFGVPRETRADIAANDARDVYTGDGTTTSFTYNFKILTSGDIAVYQAGTLKTLTTHYTLTGVGNDAGGTVVFVTAPAKNEQVLLLRNQAIEQTSSYVAGAVSAATIERDFDRQTAVDQMQAEQIARSLRYPITTTPTTGLTELPTPVADKCLGYDNAGTALQMNDCTGGSGEVSTHAALTTAHGSTDANTASRIVQRDASGNFSAGTITATLAGNASTATALAANPANCTSSFPRGITAAGVTEDCDQVSAADISPNSVGAAAVDETDNFAYSGKLIAETVFASLPGAGTAGRFRWVTDCESASECSVGSGSVRGLVYDDGVSWVLIGSSTATPTLETVMTAGNSTTKCTEADPCQFGNGTVYINAYVSDANQMVIEPSTAADRYLQCMTNQVCGIYDQEAATAVLTIDPDAASTLAMYTFGTAYKPKKTIDFPAASLTTDTVQCASPALATINSGQPRYTIICTENDASTIYGEVVMPDAWDGGTVTFKHRYVQTAADTGSMLSDIAAACRRSGDTINNTWGSEVAIDDAAVSGSNIIDMTTSAAVTPNGTCAGGALLQFRWQYDGTGNPTTAAATLHHLGFTMEYSIVSLSD